MCDDESECLEIDALLGRLISPFWFADPGNAQALVDLACKCLRDDCGVAGPDDVVRARCEVYVAWRMRSSISRMIL